LRESLKAYGLAVLVTSAAVALTRLTWPFFSVAPFAPLFGAVALSAHWGNSRAGIFSTAIGALGLALVFPPGPPYGWTPALVIYVAIALIGSYLIGGRNVALKALRASEAELRATLEHVRESERKLRRAQKMEAVGQLAAGVAHNFNNLLQVTMGYTDVLMDSRRDGALDEMAIAEIRRATERGASLTRQLLAFGRKHDARVVRVAMDATIGALRDMLTRVSREDITLTMHLDSGGAAVMIDPNDLEQAVFNLVINARDALPGGGAIHVGVSRLTVDAAMKPADSAAVPGEYVCLRVRDNGIGMTPDIVAHLFEPFFTTKEVGTGTGLGLPFVDGIARHAGGFVTIDTAPGKGTTVSVFLPVAPAAATTPAAAPPVARARRSAPRTVTIRLVEDEEGVRATTSRILQHAGYNVISAASALEALDAFEKARSSIDLLLTDVVMPDMHGPELAERLLALRPELPIVFVSGYSDVMPASATATAQMAFIPKPFAAATLVATVERLLVTA
jgi:two-component system, cell cycle sensor histidine kinase and response regulator CckA